MHGLVSSIMNQIELKKTKISKCKFIDQKKKKVSNQTKNFWFGLVWFIRFQTHNRNFKLQNPD